MSKARMLSALMLVCLLVLGICSWAGAEEVIIVDKALTERVAVPADEPIISGAMSPMLGESYTYTITHADLVDNLTVTLYETEPVPDSTSYYLIHGQPKTPDANDSFQHTFTVEGKFVVRISFTKNGESVNRNLWVDSVDRTAQQGHQGQTFQKQFHMRHPSRFCIRCLAKHVLCCGQNAVRIRACGGNSDKLIPQF